MLRRATSRPSRSARQAHWESGKRTAAKHSPTRLRVCVCVASARSASAPDRAALVPVPTLTRHENHIDDSSDPEREVNVAEGGTRSADEVVTTTVLLSPHTARP